MSDIVKIGRFLSYVLRHSPESIGLTLDSGGWATISDLIKCSGENGNKLTEDMIFTVVNTNDKKRFIVNKDGLKIKAVQGHSIKVNLHLKPIAPPQILYHGTAVRFLDSIMCEGLTRQNRQYVHLSKDELTASKVGSRHGKSVVLKIEAKKMYDNGIEFFLAENGVWLTDYVASEYFHIISE